MRKSFEIENEFMLGPDVPGEESSRWPYWYESKYNDIEKDSVNGVFSSDIIGNELPIDKFSFTVRYNDQARSIYRVRDTGYAYQCAGSIGGTLEESGWADVNVRHPAILSENIITFLYPDNTYAAIKPPGSRYFNGGDVLELSITVISNEGGWIGFGDNQVNSYVAESMTGLFTFYPGRSPNVGSRCSTTGTGYDVLRFKIRESALYSVLPHGAASPGATIRINGLKYNGEMVFGTMGNDPDQPPQLYLLKQPYAAKDYLTNADYGTPCWWKLNGSLFVRGYLSETKRSKKNAWKLTCVSGVGLLVEKMHVGNIYTGESFNEVMAAIVGDAFSWVADADVGAVKIYGWLPYTNARRNLHQLLFATGAVLQKHDFSDGETYDFDVIFPGGSTKMVSGSRVDINGTVAIALPATGVEITEHSFSALESDPVETLYDNTTGDASAAEHLPVIFSEPMHNLQVSDPETLIIEESGVNYAIISGVGTLTGQKYTHSETIVSFGDTTGSRVKRVTDNGLITVANSYNVARRVLNYFQKAKKVTARIKLTKPTENTSMEWCGDTLRMPDAWGEPLKAYLSTMELSVTSAAVARCELIDGYTPTNGGNNYNRYKIYKRTTSNKTWTAKKDGTIRLILIQGGTGGQGGCAGHVGWGGYPKGGTEDPDYSPGLLIHTSFTYYNDVNQEMGIATEFCYTQDRQESMPGGAAGEPGGQGKLIVVSKEVLRGDTITFDIGKGGKGGNARQNGSTSGGLGAEGTHSTATCTRNGEVIWTVTSEDGAVSETGFYETFTNTTYALPGEVGHDGGAGGMTSVDSLSYALNASKGLKGGSVGEYSGGVGGKGASHNTGMIGRLYRNGPLGNLLDVACGGGGGGAAWGATGSVGGNAKVYSHPEDDRGNPLNPYILSGKGGDGANAVAPAKAQPGCGGIGGNGGGSGGNSGGGTVYKTFQGAGYDIDVGRHLDVAYPGTQYEYEYPTTDDFGGGLAGKGSAGGAGGDGLGILYYEG